MVVVKSHTGLIRILEEENLDLLYGTPPLNGHAVSAAPLVQLKLRIKQNAAWAKLSPHLALSSIPMLHGDRGLSRSVNGMAYYCPE